MAVSKRCKKLWCLLYSFLLFLSGLFLIAYSIYLGYKLTYYFKFLPWECIAPFIIILLVGIGHIAFTWLAIKATRTSYPFYICLLIVITILFVLCEAGVSTWALVIRGKLNDRVAELTKSSFEEFIKSNYHFDKLEWINLQAQFECCGINNLTDYTVGSFPTSCCSTSSTGMCTKVYQKGCQEYLINYTKQLLLYQGLAGFASVLFLILGLIIFYNFYKMVKQQAAEDGKLRASVLPEINPLNKPPPPPRTRDSSLKKPLGNP